MAKILFIDDDVQTLELMARSAKILGHEAILCPSSDEAIQHVYLTQPDLVLVDINMQDLSGFEIVQQIRNSEIVGATPVLVLSAGEPDIEGVKAIEAGANGFLAKPLTIQNLENAIRKFSNHNHKPK
ncbi:MAG: hypothetical protein BGO78_03605 [Chloroflexi bacterium 44-23]|nr:MAG: hypothetical protein BGO78_03605 [Chloroflexi bacterium 44-23]